MSLVTLPHAHAASLDWDLPARSSQFGTSRSTSSGLGWLHSQLLYQILRDHAFEVEGARRSGPSGSCPGSNLRWKVTIGPNRIGDTTVTVLPATEDCDVEGAVSTRGDRKLSERVELTVAGPVRKVRTRAQMDRRVSQPHQPGTGLDPVEPAGRRRLGSYWIE